MGTALYFTGQKSIKNERSRKITNALTELIDLAVRNYIACSLGFKGYRQFMINSQEPTQSCRQHGVSVKI